MGDIFILRANVFSAQWAIAGWPHAEWLAPRRVGCYLILNGVKFRFFHQFEAGR